MSQDPKEQRLPLNPRKRSDKPLTPALSPYPAFVGLRRGTKGERENRSLVFEHAKDLDFRRPWDLTRENIGLVCDQSLHPGFAIGIHFSILAGQINSRKRRSNGF